MNNKINIPNALAVLRLILAPVIMYFMLNSMNYTALIFFIVALSTDFFDGFIARKYNLSTRFGKILDPISDKLLYGFVLYGVLIREKLVFWMWFFGIVGIIYIIGYLFFVEKKMKVKGLGRFFVVIESLLMIIMIYGFVNNLIIILFVIFLMIPLVSYFIEMIKK